MLPETTGEHNMSTTALQPQSVEIAEARRVVRAYETMWQTALKLNAPQSMKDATRAHLTAAEQTLFALVNGHVMSREAWLAS